MRSIMKKLVALLIVVSPILRYYKFPVLNIDFDLAISLFIFIFEVIIILTGKNLRFKCKLNEQFIILFVLWIVIMSLIQYRLSPYRKLIESVTTNSFVYIILAFIILFLGYSGCMDFNHLIKTYKYTAFILCIVLIVQILGHYCFDSPYNGKIPFLKLQETYQIREINFGIYKTESIIRFSSLFIEPSHLAQFLGPLLCMLLYGCKNIVKKNIGFAVIVTVLILLSISGTGVFISAIAWLWFLFNLIKMYPKEKVLSALGIALCLGIMFIMVMQLPEIKSLIVSKAGYRIFRGFSLYSSLPFIYQIFGSGYKCINAIANYYGLTTSFDTASTLEYANDIAMILINFGIIGFILIIKPFLNYFKRGNKLQQLLLLICFALFLSEAMFSNTMWRLLIFSIFAVFNQSYYIPCCKKDELAYD